MSGFDDLLQFARSAVDLGVSIHICIKWSMEKSANPYKRVGEQLLQLRSEAGLSQSEAAAIANTTQPTWSRWERGLGAPDVVQAAEIERSTGKDLRVF